MHSYPRVWAEPYVGCDYAIVHGPGERCVYVGPNASGFIGLREEWCEENSLDERYSRTGKWKEIFDHPLQGPVKDFLIHLYLELRRENKRLKEAVCGR